MSDNNTQGKKVKRDWKGGCKYLVIWGTLSFIFSLILSIAAKNDFWIKKDPTQVCIDNLRTLEASIKDYHEVNEHYPQNLEVLAEEIYLIDELPVCPITKQNYIYEKINLETGDFYIKCPNPEKHKDKDGMGLRELYYHPVRGIIAVPMK